MPRIRILVMLMACCLAHAGAEQTLASDEKTRINNFYCKLMDLVKTSKTAEAFAAVVAQDRSTAEKCLVVVQQKAGWGGDQAESFGLLQQKIQDALVITEKQVGCTGPPLDRLLAAAARQVEDQDKIFYLEQITRLCPSVAEAYHRLGDLYLRDRRAGMAVAAYKRGLELRNDADSLKLLDEAQKLLAQYRTQEPLTTDAVRNLFTRPTLMAPRRDIVRKVEIKNSLPTNRIHFDEWSASVKEESLPQLNTLGQALKEELSQDAEKKLVVEGHTDKRGPLDRNLQLSEERAQAIKDYLVANFGINPARLIVKGYGPSRPFSPQEDEAAFALNRRVEFKSSETDAQ